MKMEGKQSFLNDILVIGIHDLVEIKLSRKF